jgi:hypothetical protein
MKRGKIPAAVREMTASERVTLMHGFLNEFARSAIVMMRQLSRLGEQVAELRNDNFAMHLRLYPNGRRRKQKRRHK